ncbi:MAG: tetratricopeptide repeat protein, partial [Acidobacteriia bacterium]|nr:tetratricopeptide repeat protein [Terriglobia bacterium]
RAQVTVQLIDAGSGEILWTDRYLREMRDVLALQNEIVAKIVQGIRLKVSPEEKTRLASVRAVKPETYELCAKGRFFLDKLTPEGFQKGLGYLKQAAANDPEEPLASAGVALGYVLMAHQGPAAEVPDAFERAKPYALKAMELDPTLPEAHQALAEINGYWDWNYSGAETEYRRALELSNGNIPEAHAHYSWLLAALERPDEQIAEMKRALEIDPLNPTYHIWLGQYHLEAGRRDESLIEARKALELNPETPDALVLLGDGYALGGDFSKAIANQEKAAARDPGLSRYALACTYARAGRGSEARRIAEDLRKRLRRWDAYGLAMIYAALGEKDEAFRWLEAMYRGRHPYAPWIRHFSPEFTAWQRDPRFVDLTRRLRLPNVR